jgi:hypothetical protein
VHTLDTIKHITTNNVEESIKTGGYPYRRLIRKIKKKKTLDAIRIIGRDKRPDKKNARTQSDQFTSPRSYAPQKKRPRKLQKPSSLSVMSCQMRIIARR